MSTDTEAANTVRRLQLHCPVATASLQMAVHEALTPATAAQPQEEEYQYDSDDSVLDLDEEYPGLAEQVMQWRAARQGAACAPLWRPSNFGWPEQSHFNKLPDLRELLNQAEEAKARQRAPEVAPMPLPFTSIRDLDCQCQQGHDQTIAKRQSSPLGGEQCKRAKTPPQPDPYDAPDQGRGQEEQNQGRDRGRSRTRVDRQSELDRARGKSWKRSKSCWRSKSRKHSKSRRSKSCKRDGGGERDKHEPRRPGGWSSQREREMPDQLPRTAQKDMQDAGHSAFSNDLSKFRKLKDEVVKNAQSYIRRRSTIIFHTLSPDHEAVKCLSAFGDQAQKFAVEVLTIIEWDTQHWKLQETFPVPVIPRWLRTPEFTQTTTLLRGELPLMPTGWPLRGHLHALPGDVVLDGRPPPILAGSHDSLSIRGPIPPHQRLGGHCHPGHQPVASAPGAFQLGVCGHECHVVN